MTARGAYGLRLRGVDSPLLNDAPAGWDAWRVSESRCREASGTAALIGPDRARVPLRGDGVLRVHRSCSSFEYATAQPLEPDALVHPYLAPAAAIASSWSGRVTLHGAAFLHRGGAWLAIGDAGAGKSTLAAAVMAAGCPVLADDLLVVDRGAVLAGPRCIDLRADAAAAMEMGAPASVSGGRERWRVPLGAVPAAVPAAGIVVLCPGPEPATAVVPPPERIAALLRHRAVVRASGDEARLMPLARLPMLRYARTGRIDSAVAEARALLDLLPG